MIAQEHSSARRRASCFGIKRPDRLAGRGEGRIGRIDFDQRQKRGDLALGKRARERLLDEIADHAFALGPEQVERVGPRVAVCGSLKRQQPDLRAIAVGQHDVVLARERRDRLLPPLQARCGVGFPRRPVRPAAAGRFRRER